jgi:hypothetical protein
MVPVVPNRPKEAAQARHTGSNREDNEDDDSKANAYRTNRTKLGDKRCFSRKYVSESMPPSAMQSSTLENARKREVRPKKTVFEAFATGGGKNVGIVSHIDKGRTTTTRKKDSSALFYRGRYCLGLKTSHRPALIQVSCIQ